MLKAVVVIPNWNGADGLEACISSLLRQTVKAHIIMVDNGSVDDSVELVSKRFPEVEIIRHTTNKGYAGGVNPGFRRAIELDAEYAAPFNNDAIADTQWLEQLIRSLDADPKLGIATCKVVSSDRRHIDSTGDYYTDWGLPYPRGRGEPNGDRYDMQTEIFGASGAASLFRVSMLKQTGFFDEDFFAYYEDVDLSFRAQLFGWKIRFVPSSVVYHELSVTGKRIKGFFTYQTVKNYPWLLIKNVPASLLPHIAPRLALAQLLFIGRAFLRGQGWYAVKGLTVSLLKSPKKLAERRHVQSARTVSPDYIWSILTHDLPPNAHNLRRLRAMWWKVSGHTKYHTKGPAA